MHISERDSLQFIRHITLQTFFGKRSEQAIPASVSHDATHGNFINDGAPAALAHLHHKVPERMHNVDRQGICVHCAVL